MLVDPSVEVEFYRDLDGTEPVKQSLRQVATSNPALGKRIQAHLIRLTDPKWHGPPHTEYLDDGLFEVRVLGSDGARILFFYADRRRLILVHAFVKKTRKLPERDRRVALERMKRWQERRHSSTRHE